ncbi:MAG TPA: glycosyltransferase family 4 protein [Flavobacteriales bacterium]|nr:glycosyltransferase family 4 protein [Flavobacteriales bacterium]
MKEKQVVVCTDGIFPHAVGGMQRHSRLLIENLAALNTWKIIVIHPHPEKIFSSFTNIEEVNIKGIDPKKKYLRECYNYSKRVYNVIQNYPHAVIYSQGLSVWYKQSTFSKRLIVNPHGLEPFQAIGVKDKLVAIPFKYIFKKIFNKASYIISLGGRLTDILSSIVPAQKIVVIPNAVEPVQLAERSFDHEPLRLLFVARFAHNKGIHILMRAIKNLNKEGSGSRFQFHLAGKGPLFKKYTSENNEKNIVFHGFVTDEQLHDLYRTSDAFVFPTLFEGMPTVILEAMTNGLPVISTDTGAVSELVDSNSGWLIQKNSVSQLEDALKCFANSNTEQKKSMSNYAKNKVLEKFTWQRVAQAHVLLFDTIYQSKNKE